MGAGPNSEAFKTMVQSEVNAGPSLTAERSSCEFQDTTAATTPIGSRRHQASISGLSMVNGYLQFYQRAQHSNDRTRQHRLFEGWFHG